MEVSGGGALSSHPAPRPKDRPYLSSVAVLSTLILAFPWAPEQEELHPLHPAQVSLWPQIWLRVRIPQKVPLGGGRVPVSSAREQAVPEGQFRAAYPFPNEPVQGRATPESA